MEIVPLELPLCDDANSEHTVPCKFDKWTQCRLRDHYRSKRVQCNQDSKKFKIPPEFVHTVEPYVEIYEKSPSTCSQSSKTTTDMDSSSDFSVNKVSSSIFCASEVSEASSMTLNT